MIFKDIQIRNLGVIDKLDYEAKLDSNGRPIPLILLGKNGSGKTLVISSIVDSYIEVKKLAFNSKIAEVNSHNNYYVALNPNYIKDGRTFFSVRNKMIFDNNEYISYMFEGDENKSKLFDIGWASDVIKNYSKSSAFKCIDKGNIEEEIFRNEIFLYFPVGRSSNVLWQNNDNKSYWFNSQRISGQSDDCCVIYDLYYGIEQYLKDLFLDKYASLEQTRSQMMFDSITKILRRIRNSPSGRFYVNERRNRQLGFRWENDNNEIISQSMLRQFSSGEMQVLGIAINIFKTADIYQNNFNGTLEDIRGTVIIDEADLNLHIDLQYNLLPQIMKLFPNVQFILSTQSPFLLAGLKREYGNYIDFLIMPDGARIDDINQFNEIVDAYKIFSKETEYIIESKNNLETVLANMDNGVYVYTEGKTDASLMNVARERLNIENLDDVVFEQININGKNSGNIELNKLIDMLIANPGLNKGTLICMYDRDVDVKLTGSDGVEHNLLDEDFVDLGNNVYAFAIPVPHKRKEKNQISIEHYFTDKEIKQTDFEGKRLFLVNEFYSTGNHKSEDYHYNNIRKNIDSIKIIELESNYYVTDKEGNGNYSLSKSRFVENIANKVEGFDDFDFNEFNKIFSIIKHILKR